jgi:hypothetical protein
LASYPDEKESVLKGKKISPDNSELINVRGKEKLLDEIIWVAQI